MEPIYHEGETYIPLANAVRRLGVSERELRWIVAHGKLRHHFHADELYLREGDIDALQKDPEALAKALPKSDPRTLAARVQRL